MNEHVRVDTQPIPFIDVAAQRRRLGKTIDEAVGRVLNHCQFILGPEVRELEAALAAFSGARWEALAAKGARVQRPLWASTSTKNPAYSPTLYVDTLIGRDTVNTLAQASVDALEAGDGNLRADTVLEDLDAARATMAGLAAAGIDFDDVTATLEREGVSAFAASFHDALESLEKKARELTR